MLKAFETFVDQLSKNAKQGPGWAPLTAVCYILFELLLQDKNVQGTPIANHKALIVAAGALVLYTVGDALDKAVWKRIEPSFVDEARKIAEDALGVKTNDGLYRVSKALAVAAKQYDGSWIQFKNEWAKLLRSGIVPCGVAVLVFVWRGQFVWSGSALLGGGLCLFGYVRMKASHIRDLYRLTKTFKNDGEKFLQHDLPCRVRIFFWNGESALSALRFEEGSRVENRDKAG